jgi:hypothetical protein
LNPSAFGFGDQAPVRHAANRPEAAALHRVFRPRLTVSVDNTIYFKRPLEEDSIMIIKSSIKTCNINYFTLYHCMNYERKKYDGDNE